MLQSIQGVYNGSQKQPQKNKKTAPLNKTLSNPQKLP